MQQDWKAIWDNLNPDEAAKERMKQAILQQMQAEPSQTVSPKPPFLQRLSFGTFARAAALCCMTVTVALAGLHLTDRRTEELLPAPSVSDLPAETTTPQTLPVQTTAASQTRTTTHTQTTLQTTAARAESAETSVQTAEPPAAAVETLDTTTADPHPSEEPVQTEPVCTTEPEPVLTTTVAETAASTEPETTTVTFRGVATYGSLFDFQYARWNGVHYQTDYSTVSYEDLDDLAGFSVAMQAEGDRVYTILVYPLKGYSIQDCIAVQYAGDEDYFYFYAIS